MSTAKEIKEKNTKDSIFGIFNPDKKEFVKIDSYPNKSTNYTQQTSNSQPNKAVVSQKALSNKQKEHPTTTKSKPSPSQPKSIQQTYNKPNYPIKNKQSNASDPKHPLSSKDKARQQIAISNHDFVRQHPELISKSIETIYINDHKTIQQQLKPIKSKFEHIYINDHSTIWTAIDLHKRNYKHIYILNFADSLKPGGGYLNGRGAQEETLCRQTLLYPTICNNPIYEENKKYGHVGSNNMIYSSNVLVIRDDDYNFLPKNDQFSVNIISSAAVDNRKKIKDAAAKMEDRIRKIITLAAVKSIKEKEQGKNALILGAFGCGVFDNDPNLISSIFAKILHDEKFKHYFNCIVFPIFKDKNNIIPIFKRNLIK